MKALVTNQFINVAGHEIPPGTKIAIVDAAKGLPIGQALGAFNSGLASFVDDDGTELPVFERSTPKAETTSETNVDSGSFPGLDSELAKKLAAEGLNDVAELRTFVESGNSIASLESITRAEAKSITAWLKTQS